MLNFAAESHVDRSIDGPAAFVQTNVVGTLSLLEAVRDYWRDSKAVEFGEKYIEALPVDIAKALTAMSEIERVLKKIKTACE